MVRLINEGISVTEINEMRSLINKNRSLSQSRDLIYDICDYISTYGSKQDQKSAGRVLDSHIDYDDQYYIDDNYADYIEENDVEEVVDTLISILRTIDNRYINEFKQTPVHQLGKQSREILKLIFSKEDLSASHYYTDPESLSFDYLKRIRDPSTSPDYYEELTNIYKSGGMRHPEWVEEYDYLYIDGEYISESVKFLDLQKKILNGNVVV